MKNLNRDFILASGSLRRQEILSYTGLKFRVIIPEVDETPGRDLRVKFAAEDIAERKAEKVLEMVDPMSVIIAADTLIEIDNQVLGKPTSTIEAKEILSKFSGRCHSVTTGICIKIPEIHFSLTSSKETDVYFKPISESAIDFYINSNPVLEWAGGYAIQGTASMFIEKISGDYLNVVGLSLSLLYDMLMKAGFDLQRKIWYN